MKFPQEKESMLSVFREAAENKKMSGKYYTAANYVSFINKFILR